MSRWTCRGSPSTAVFDRGRRWAVLGLFWLVSCTVTGAPLELGVDDAAAVKTDAVTVESGTGAIAEADTTAGATTNEAADSSREAAETDAWLQLRGATVETLGETHRLVFDLTRSPAEIKYFRLSEPPRIVVDVRGPHKVARTVNRYIADNSLVEKVRVGHYDGRMRLVVDLKSNGPDEYTVREEGKAVVIYLGELGSESIGEPETLEHAGDHSDVNGHNIGDEESITTTTAAAGDQSEKVTAASDRPKVQVQPPTQDAKTTAPRREPEPAADPSPTAPTARLSKLTPVRDPGQFRRARKFHGQHISLDFKDADIQNVFRIIADVSKLNVVVTDDVTGHVTLHLNDVPWDQALDIVLESNRLKMVREGNVIRISTVDRVREEQEALRAQQKAELELEPLRVRYVRVNYARADTALVEKIKGVLTARGTAAFDERTNTIILRDIGRGIRDAIELISHLDIQSPQVLIEANIVEAASDFARGLGVQWGYSHQIGPTTGNPTGHDFPGTVSIGGTGLGSGAAPPSVGSGAAQAGVPLIADFPVPANFGSGFGAGAGSALNLALGSISGQDSLSARLTALEEDGKARIISRPRVITLNNVPATIQSLTILRVKLPSTGTVVSTGVGGVAGAANAATEEIETGIVLVVTPQVSADGFVLLNIRAKSSQADFTRTVDEIPVEVSREATSNVLIRDSETVVLGGIFRNEASDRNTGVPYLRHVPGLGWLFKRILQKDRKEELLVFITPQIVAGYGAELPTAGELWKNRVGG